MSIREWGVSLMNIIDRVRSSRFVRDERGSVTIEFVIWVMPFIFMLAATVDASMLYLTHTEMWNVSRDLARRLAIGDMTEAEAVDEARKELFLYGNDYTLATSVGTDVVVEISTSFKDASVFGIFGAVIDGNLTARVVMRKEPA